MAYHTNKKKRWFLLCYGFCGVLTACNLIVLGFPNRLFGFFFGLFHFINTSHLFLPLFSLSWWPQPAIKVQFAGVITLQTCGGGGRWMAQWWRWGGGLGQWWRCSGGGGVEVWVSGGGAVVVVRWRWGGGLDLASSQSLTDTGLVQAGQWWPEMVSSFPTLGLFKDAGGEGKYLIIKSKDCQATYVTLFSETSQHRRRYKSSALDWSFSWHRVFESTYTFDQDMVV